MSGARLHAAVDEPVKLTRDRSLDAFRALFILAVMLFHYLARWAPPRNPVDLYGYDYSYTRYLELCKFGVHAFFMISGLFIAVTLLRSADATEFVYKRLYRIVPAFLVAALFTFVVVNLFGPGQLKVGLKGLLLTLTLLGTDTGMKMVDGAYWSLAVEAKFYFWVAIAFVLFRKRFWIGLLVLGAVGVAVEFVSPSVADHVFLAPFLPLFLAGVALAYQTFLAQPRTAAILFPAAALLYLCHWDAYTLRDGQTLLPNIVILLSVGTVIAFTLAKVRIDHPLLVYLGLISYEIYLVHQNLGVTLIAQMKHHLGVPDWIAFCTAAGVAIALAAALHHVAQRPVQWVLRTLWMRLRQAPPPRPVAD